MCMYVSLSVTSLQLKYTDLREDYVPFLAHAAHDAIACDGGRGLRGQKSTPESFAVSNFPRAQREAHDVHAYTYS